MAAITDRLTLAIQGVAARTAAHSTTKPVSRRPEPRSLLVTSGTKLLVLSLATRTTSVPAKGFTLPVGVALDASGRTADVAAGTGMQPIVAVPVRKKPKLTKIHLVTGIPGRLTFHRPQEPSCGNQPVSISLTAPSRVATRVTRQPGPANRSRAREPFGGRFARPIDKTYLSIA